MKNTPPSPKPETPKFTNFAEMLACAQELTGTDYFPRLKDNFKEPTIEPTIDDLKKDLRDYKASADRLAIPFSPYQQDFSKATPTPTSTRWLWQNHIPLSGITVLDGDHNCGKSLLALQIAAAVSSGIPMPDGTPTIQGGVVIVTPTTDANAQLRLLNVLGADLSRIHILSFIQEPAPEPHTGGYRPFTLPEDLISLFVAIKRIDARLIIFDPFIHLLSRKMRTTTERLCHLLSDLNQRLIERDAACLLLRNCPAKGGHARPSVLEKSDHFATIAISRLLLAPDPMESDRLLLSHVHNRYAALTPTLTLKVQRTPSHPDLPSLTCLGQHNLQARDFLENRADMLHRRLLAEHLLRLLTEAKGIVPVATLYDQCPHSSSFQVQRALNDLLRVEKIRHPSRGRYMLVIAKPPEPIPTHVVKGSTPTTPASKPANKLNATAATTPEPTPTNKLNETAATTPEPMPPNKLNGTAARTPEPTPTNKLNGTAARTPEPIPTNKLNGTAATTPNTQPPNKLTATAATTPNTQPPNRLTATAATTPDTEPASELNETAATTPKSTSTTTRTLQWVNS